MLYIHYVLDIEERVHMDNHIYGPVKFRSVYTKIYVNKAVYNIYLYNMYIAIIYILVYIRQIVDKKKKKKILIFYIFLSYKNKKIKIQSFISPVNHY